MWAGFPSNVTKNPTAPKTRYIILDRTKKVSANDRSSWVQSWGPVTTESIVRFDTWFELFEVLTKKLAPMTLAKKAAEFVRSQNPKWPPVAILEM